MCVCVCVCVLACKQIIGEDDDDKHTTHARNKGECYAKLVEEEEEEEDEKE